MILSGKVEDLKNETIYTYSDGGSHTFNRATFQINGRVVIFESNKEYPLSNGDDISVSGKIKKGNFLAYAFKTKNKNLSGNTGYKWKLVGGFTLLILCIISASLYGNKYPSSWIVYLILFLASGYYFQQGFMIRSFIIELKKSRLR